MEEQQLYGKCIFCFKFVDGFLEDCVFEYEEWWVWQVFVFKGGVVVNLEV